MMIMNDFYSRTHSSKDNWETPPYFFKLLDNEFGFTLDPCSSEENHLCNKYYTKEENGLLQSWAGEIVFVNPPFSNMKEWVSKCYRESLAKDTIIVMIMPSRTDTKYWHNYVMKATEIRFCKGRVNFNLEGKKPKAGSTFPLCIVVWKSNLAAYITQNSPKVNSYEHKW